MTDEFFRARLDQMMDLRDPLAAFARRIHGTQLKRALAPAFERPDREGRVVV